MNTDEMLRVYESADGFFVVRFGNKCFIRLDTDGQFFFLATPDDAGEWAAKAVVKKWQLKRVKTINVTLEQEVEAAILTHNMERGRARRFVAATRRLAQKMTNIFRYSLEVRMINENDEEVITRYEQGRLVARKVDDVLDAEIIDG